RMACLSRTAVTQIGSGPRTYARRVKHFQLIPERVGLLFGKTSHRAIVYRSRSAPIAIPDQKVRCAPTNHEARQDISIAHVYSNQFGLRAAMCRTNSGLRNSSVTSIRQSCSGV